MSDIQFGREYADEYDILYSDKDYEAECNLLEDVFKRYGKGPIKNILDIGCGTGSHAIPLALRGYQVVGVDRSAEMLDHAQRKLHGGLQSSMDRQIRFMQGDARTLDLHQEFDAAIMMFSVLGLLTTNADVLAALRAVRRSLKKEGLFVFDVWFGPAVLTIRPGDRIKIIPTENGQVIRTASGSLDILRHLSSVHFHVWHLRNAQLENEADEIQWTRYFFPQELALFMEQSKLELIHMCAVEDLDQVPTDRTWNVLVVAKAV